VRKVIDKEAEITAGLGKTPFQAGKRGGSGAPGQRRYQKI